MKHEMIDNYRFIPHNMRHATLDIPKPYDKRKMEKCFIRFLKENKIYRDFINNYNNKEISDIYRKYLVKTCAMKQIGDKLNLVEFINEFDCNLYFVDSFLWDDKDFWSEVHCKWLDYVKKQINCGLV